MAMRAILFNDDPATRTTFRFLDELVQMRRHGYQWVQKHRSPTHLCEGSA